MADDLKSWENLSKISVNESTGIFWGFFLDFKNTFFFTTVLNYCFGL